MTPVYEFRVLLDMMARSRKINSRKVASWVCCLSGKPQIHSEMPAENLSKEDASESESEQCVPSAYWTWNSRDSDSEQLFTFLCHFERPDALMRLVTPFLFLFKKLCILIAIHVTPFCLINGWWHVAFVTSSGNSGKEFCHRNTDSHGQHHFQ